MKPGLVRVEPTPRGAQSTRSLGVGNVIEVARGEDLNVTGLCVVPASASGRHSETIGCVDVRREADALEELLVLIDDHLTRDMRDEIHPVRTDQRVTAQSRSADESLG